MTPGIVRSSDVSGGMDGYSLGYISPGHCFKFVPCLVAEKDFEEVTVLFNKVVVNRLGMSKRILIRAFI